MSVREVVKYYQKCIENSSGEEATILHSLEQLYQLPVTLQDLEETMVGRTVNGLRGREGEIGVAAKTVVCKWKIIVAENVSPETDDEDGVGDNNNDNEDCELELKIAEMASSSYDNLISDLTGGMNVGEKHINGKSKTSDHNTACDILDNSEHSVEKKKRHRSSYSKKKCTSTKGGVGQQVKTKEETLVDVDPTASTASLKDRVHQYFTEQHKLSKSSGKEKNDQSKDKSKTSEDQRPRKEIDKEERVSASEENEPHKEISFDDALDMIDLAAPSAKKRPSKLKLPSTSRRSPALIKEETLEYKTASDPITYQQSPYNFAQKIVFQIQHSLETDLTRKKKMCKTFTGNKRGKYEVSSLFDLCIRVLQMHIDNIEYTGGVPYEILYPVLKKATSSQLLNLEYNNPYLVESTDQLWQFHCAREFKGKARQSMESWRETYARCQEEQDAKIKTLTKNIKQSQEMTRHSKTEFVNEVTLAPKNVARKLGLHKVRPLPLVTPEDRLLVAFGTDVKIPRVKHIRVDSPAARKVPPLMQKALACMRTLQSRR